MTTARSTVPLDDAHGWPASVVYERPPLRPETPWPPLEHAPVWPWVAGLFATLVLALTLLSAGLSQPEPMPVEAPTVATTVPVGAP